MSFWEGQCFTVQGWEFENRIGEKVGSFMYSCTQVFPEDVDDDQLRSVGSNAEAGNASGEWFIYVIGCMAALFVFLCGSRIGYVVYTKRKKMANSITDLDG